MATKNKANGGKPTAGTALETVKKEANDVVLFDYGALSADGFENQTAEDIQIPFLALLQPLSPQVGVKPVEGARAGLLMNTVTESIYPGPVTFVPCYKERAYVEWVPRTAGGGFVARHEKDSELVVKLRATGNRFAKLTNPANGNDIVETVYLYGVLCRGEDEFEPVVVAFNSTKLTPFKKWNTKLNMFSIQVNGRKQVPPLYAHLTTIGSVSQTNKKGTFFNFKLEPARGDLASSLLPPDDPRFRAALELREMVKSGVARAAEETQNKASSASQEDDASDEVF